MITISGFTGLQCQLYYVSFIIKGNQVVYGPYAYDHLLKAPAPSNSVETINFGPPVNIPFADNLVDYLVGDIDACHGEHSCSHKNGFGSVIYADPSFNSARLPRFELLPGTDSRSVLTKSCWFFDVNKASCVKDWSFASRIGYSWGSSSAASSSTLGVVHGYATYHGGSSGKYTEDGIIHEYSFSLNVVGHSWVKTTSSKGVSSLWEIDITSFQYPNKAKFRLVKDGVPSFSEGTLTMIPVTGVVPVNFQGSLPSWKNLILKPSSYCRHIDIASGTLGRAAVNSLSYISANSIENGKGWSSLKQNLPPIRNIKSPKGIAELYLWYKYSLCPNVSDVPETIRGISKAVSKHRKSSYETKYATLYRSEMSPYGMITTRANMRVRFHPRCVTEAQGAYFKLKQVGLAPTPDNLWDLVPFSFVVDWAIPVGDRLRDATYSFEAMMNMYDVYDVIDSRKTTLTINCRQLSNQLIGFITYTAYNRTVSSYLPTDKFEYGSKVPSKHLLEGSALIVANW